MTKNIERTAARLAARAESMGLLSDQMPEIDALETLAAERLEYLTAQKQAYDKLRADIRDALNYEGKHFSEIYKYSRILHTYDEIVHEAVKRIMGDADE